MDVHPPQEQIERLALGRLPAAESLQLQRHLFCCDPCLYRLMELEVMLEMLLEDQMPKFDKRKPLYIVHDTADGLIYSQTQKRGKQWTAVHWGEQLEGGRECRTMREANEFLLKSFREMFPEHRCTRHCRVNP